ncbi:hypothetical protein ANN_07632 [Periplaneta americana]|uniref:Uncharacterized protein n=1 Tax=Periplaneta americana TaxID=6978 RepID=A0ABQ8SZT4_PERAM|nr:hypothetical protein ANN_07632 [Periplaneta americana]
MGESRNAYRVLVWRPEGKRSLGRLRRRWEDNIKMDLREVGYDDRDWINLAQNRNRWRAYVRAAVNLRIFKEQHHLQKGGHFRGINTGTREGGLHTPQDLGDNAGEMSPGSSTESYPAFARIGLRENPGKNLNQVTCPDRDSNPGHLVSQPDALTVTPQRNVNTLRERERERERGKDILNVEEAASIPKAKSVLSSDNIYGSLAFLKAHFSDLLKYIEYLESSSLQLKDAIGVIDSLLHKQVPGPWGSRHTKTEESIAEESRF